MSGSTYAIESSRNECRRIGQVVVTNSSYVAKYFSSKIISDELVSIKTAIAKSEFDDENLEIRVNDFTKEIITRYQIDEGQKNEMIIRLPPSYPLAEVEIIGASRVGVGLERWNKWLLTCKIACKVGTPLFESRAHFIRMEQLWMR